MGLEAIQEVEAQIEEAKIRNEVEDDFDVDDIFEDEAEEAIVEAEEAITEAEEAVAEAEEAAEAAEAVAEEVIAEAEETVKEEN